MASLALADLLNPQFVSEQFKEEALAVVENPMLDYFDQAARDTYGDIIEVHYVEAESRPAPLNFRGKQSKVLDEQGAKTLYFKPLHSYNSMPVPNQVIEFMRDPNSIQHQEKGALALVDAMQSMGTRIRMLRAVALAKVLTEGVIYTDVNGNITETSGTGPTYNFQVPASNKSQLTFGSPIIATAWNNSAAKIANQLKALRQKAIELHLPQPKHIWAPTDCINWLLDNTQLKDYFIRNPRANEQILQGEMVEDLLGYTWHFYDGVYEASDGTTKPLIPRTKVIIHPEVVGQSGWFRAFNSSQLINDSTKESKTIQESIANKQVVYGDYAYIREIRDPDSTVMYTGTNFLYAFANPSAVWMPTVDF